MKSMFLLSLILISTSAFACKPEPLASCEGEKSIVLKMDIVKQLQSKVTDFHKQLDDALIPNFKGTSCFNNRIAIGYINGLKEPFTCGKQVAQIESAMNNLLDQNSETWKAIKSDDLKSKLEGPVTDVKSVLKYFLKEHAN